MDHSQWGRGQCLNLLHWFEHPASPLPWPVEAEADFSVRALLEMERGADLQSHDPVCSHH